VLKKNNHSKRLVRRRKGIKRHRRQIKSNRKKKEIRRLLQGKSHVRRYKDKDDISKKFPDYKKVFAPKKLSLVENPEKTIAFVNQLRKCFKRRKKVFVLLSQVESVGYDALVVLLSILIRFKSHKIDFNGDFPKNNEALSKISNSGFFDYLYKNINNEERYKILKGGSISTHAWKKVDSELTHEVIRDAAQFIWGKPRTCNGVQRSLIELMHNTNNHAAYEAEGEKHWFLSVQHIKQDKKVCFSFVDFGVGIFESLNNKGKESKWYDWKTPLSKLFTFENNSELLRLILNGELHKTVTGKPYRGKGLPGIYDASKRNYFNKLHVISNDVFANIESVNFKTLSNKFTGTFVYWEVDANNVNYEGID
tara:strand:- start:2516 stop:3610 length:1095 start_codon:yes stop_codon:yes gene_type:complete